MDTFEPNSDFDASDDTSSYDASTDSTEYTASGGFDAGIEDGQSVDIDGDGISDGTADVSYSDLDGDGEDDATEGVDKLEVLCADGHFEKETREHKGEYWSDGARDHGCDQAEQDEPFLGHGRVHLLKEFPCGDFLRIGGCAIERLLGFNGDLLKGLESHDVPTCPTNAICAGPTVMRRRLGCTILGERLLLVKVVVEERRGQRV